MLRMLPGISQESRTDVLDDEEIHDQDTTVALRVTVGFLVQVVWLSVLQWTKFSEI